MRTKTLLIAAAAMAVGLASSTAQVYSLNVVGYVNKVLVGPGKYTGVANPLNTTNNTLTGLFGGPGVGLASGSAVLKWNNGLADFDTYTKTGFGAGWSPAGGATTSLNPGEGCLIFTALTYSGDITNTFVGEVLQGNLTNAMVTGYQLVGNPVPDSGPVSSLQLTNVPAPGSALLKWNTTLQDWDTFNKTTFGLGWSPSVPSVDVAEGFLLQAASPFDWVRNFTVPATP